VIVLGMWLAIIGYGVAYAGVRTLAGDNCGLVQAFQGTCSSAGTAPAKNGGRGGPGVTIGASRRALYDRQMTWLGQQRVLAQRAGVP
jgi:hypothetical protein